MRTALKLLAYAWLVILASGILLWSQSGSIIHTYTFASRIAAGILILAIILNFVAEFGWLGGDKTKTSHMYDDHL